MALSCILLLLDGLGDRAYGELDGLTPLQAATTPHLDGLAARGWCGMLHATRPGQALPSENAHFALFGYEAADFPGRGYLEALGAGLSVADQDVALLAHFVSLKEDNGRLVLHQHRPAASEAELMELIAAVASHAGPAGTARYQPTHNLDGIVTLHGRVAPEITDSDPIDLGEPLMQVLPWAAPPDPVGAQNAADLLNDYLLRCHRLLSNHPVNEERRRQGLPLINGLATQRAGRARPVEPFGRRWGLRGLSIASGLVYWGLGRYLGLDVCQVRDSKSPGDDLAERLDLALAKRAAYDFIHVHTKAPDAAAHTKEPHNKVRAIEALDRGLGSFLKRLDDETLLVVTADHSTPSSGPLVHSGEPVPLLFVGPGVRRDRVQHFDEIACAGGALGFLAGRDFLPMVLNCLDRSKLTGLMDCPHDRPYWPGARHPLLVKGGGAGGADA